MSPKDERRHIWFPQELWDRCTMASARETLETGKRVTVSEWIRRACEKRLNEEGS